MKAKKILSSAILYGFGDFIVLAIGGIFLVPLYTRTLSQSEYGIYIITMANTDLFVYLLHFGLISAVLRLYFDYKKRNEHFQYISSVILLFICISFVFGLVIYLRGNALWSILSPSVSSWPYIWFCFSFAIFNFFSSMALIWLRAESKAYLFVIIQIASSLVLLILVIYNLIFAKNGLLGLLYALLAAHIFSASFFFFLLNKKLSLCFKIEHLKSSLQFSAPIAIGYCAYFLLNRGNMIVLQRYVSLEQVAVFGLAHQMAMIVLIVSNAFIKSFQPIIYSAEDKDVASLIGSSGKIYLLLIFCVTNVVILFASDILNLVAPMQYSNGFHIFLIMLIANFIFSASFCFDIVLLYFKLTMTSTLISILGGVSALFISFLLIPRYHLYGAALSSLFAFSGVLFLGFFAAKKIIKSSDLKYTLCLLLLTTVMAFFSIWLRELEHTFSFFIKLVLLFLFIYIVYSLYNRKRYAF